MTKISRNYRDKVRKRLWESADVKKKVAEQCLGSILEAAQLIVDTLVLTGKSGKLQKIADVSVCVPSIVTQYIQECHIAIEHILCGLAEHHIFASTFDKKGKAWL